MLTFVRTYGCTDRRTDRRTDEQTERQKLYTPRHTSYGYNNLFSKVRNNRILNIKAAEQKLYRLNFVFIAKERWWDVFVHYTCQCFWVECESLSSLLHYISLVMSWEKCYSTCKQQWFRQACTSSKGNFNQGTRHVTFLGQECILEVLRDFHATWLKSFLPYDQNGFQ